MAARGRFAPCSPLHSGKESSPLVTEVPASPFPGLLRMVGQFLIAQTPILPKLERSQQDDDPAKGDMPGSKHVVARVAEDER
jgi:hypothetical protein